VIGIELRYINDVPVARPRGDIDAATASGVRAQLIDCMSNNAANLVLDLSQTRYVDSAGIDMLFRLAERLRERRAHLLLVVPSDSQLLALAELVGLPRAMPVCDSVEQALARCEQRSRAVQEKGLPASC
jgi:anti-anti-sigma factor